jgi:hypothetical protein
MGLIKKVILKTEVMEKFYLSGAVSMLILFSVAAFAQPQYTLTTNIGATQEEWNTTGAWSVPAGFTPTGGFPDADFDEDANTATPLSTADHGAYIIIDAGDNIKIPNNVVIDLSNSRLIRITIRANAELHFGSNAQLILPAGCEIVFEAGAQMIADSNSSGTYLQIGGNGVWGRECQSDGCNNSTQTGPGVIDENSTPGSPMPVELLFFRGQPSEEGVVLDWATASELNSSYFVVQRSIDGINFLEVGREPAAENSLVRVDYKHVDSSPIIGRTYYRLVEVDLNGESETFNIIVVNFSGNKALSVYPNPIAKDQDLSITVNFASEQTNYATLMDLSGRVIRTFSFTGTTFQISDKPEKGSYVVKVTNAGKSYVTRFSVF